MSTANIYAESTLHNKVFNEQRSNAKHVGLFIQDSLIGRDSNSKTAQTLCAVCLVGAKVGHSEVGGGTRVHL